MLDPVEQRCVELEQILRCIECPRFGGQEGFHAVPRLEPAVCGDRLVVVLECRHPFLEQINDLLTRRDLGAPVFPERIRGEAQEVPVVDTRALLQRRSP